ncbi:LysR family transcriptional regulator [Francisellaceae bacterium]|nr:LysR family transcriptional regulator [Francisellaceae bacterium]
MRAPHIQNIIIFCLVAKHKSTKIVANLLNLDTSTITRNIKSLEDNLELTLMNREKHFIGLTSEGEKLYKEYQVSIAYYEDLILNTQNIYNEHVQNKEIKILLPMLGSEELLNVSLFNELEEILQGHSIFIDGLSASDISSFPHVAIQKAISADILFIPEKLADDLPEQFNTTYHYKDLFYLCGSAEYLSKHEINTENFKVHIMCKVDEPFNEGAFSFLNDFKTRIKVDNSHKLSALLQSNYGIAPMPVAPIKKLLETNKLKIILPEFCGEQNWYLSRKVHKSLTLNNKLIEAADIIKKWIMKYTHEQQLTIDKYFHHI